MTIDRLERLVRLNPEHRELRAALDKVCILLQHQKPVHIYADGPEIVVTSVAPGENSGEAVFRSAMSI
jgi:hypothetical protein